jgi:hypothetical protein
MTFKQFVDMASKELYRRSEVAEGLESEGSHRPGSVVFRASAGVLENMYRRYSGSIVQDADTETKRADAVPLVIVEGEEIEGAEAILVGDVNAVLIDWESLEGSPDRARDIGTKLRQYFESTGQPTGARVDGILRRIGSILRDADEEDVYDNETEDEIDPDRETLEYPLGKYKGIPHTGEAGCPACNAFMKNKLGRYPEGFPENLKTALEGQQQPRDFRPSPMMNLGGFGAESRNGIQAIKEKLDSIPVDRQQEFRDRLTSIIVTMVFDPLQARDQLRSLKRDFGLDL